jgi:hypothetical protein
MKFLYFFVYFIVFAITIVSNNIFILIKILWYPSYKYNINIIN